MPSLTTSFRAVFHRHASWVRPLAVLNLLVIGSLLWPSATAAMIFPRQVNVAVNRLLSDSSFSLPARRSPLELTLRVTPAQIELQGIVTYTVIISNTLASDTLTGLEVSDRLPPSLRYVSAEGGVFTYLAAEHRVQWSIESLAAGETLIGAFQAQVVGVNADQPILNTVVASAATGVEVQATAILTMLSLPCLGSACTPTPTASPVTPPCMGSACTPTPTATPSPTPAAATPTWTPTPTALPGLDEVWLTPGEGGVLASDDGRIVVEAPPGAVTQRTLLRYVAQPPVGELPPWLMLPFGLEAQDEQGASVLHFATLVSLTYHFPADIVLTERIGLYRWDEASATWQTIPSQLDIPVRQLNARLDAPGLFGLGAPAMELSYGAQHLPTVHGFVTDEWSGNSNLSYPLALPPGPGGLGLNLSLSYSSEGVNSIRQGPSTYTMTVPGPTPTATVVVNQDESNAKTFNRQASLVGWGWSLSGLGQITMVLAQGGTPAKAYLGYAGGGFELKQDASNGWQTEPQSFVRIAHEGNMDSGNKWEVWAPDGTKYTFGGASWGNGVAWIRTSVCGQLPREMHLTEVLDTHGNRIVVTYGKEMRDVNCNGPSHDYVRAIRPMRIEYYANGQSLASMRIVLNYSPRSDTGVPGHVGDEPDDEYIEAFYSDYRLTGITIQVRNESAADAFTTVRSYVLAQDYDWFDQNKKQGIMRLTSITEQGKNGGALPAWTFGYRIGAVGTGGSDWKNHTLLETANNGQGGSVTFSYANVANIWMQGCGKNTSRYRVSQMAVGDGLGNVQRTVYDHQNPWAWTGANGSPPGAPPDCPDFEFGGYAFVRSQLQDGAGTLYRVVENSYHQRSGTALDPRKGKMYSSITSSQAGSGELARTATTWATAMVKGRNWVYQIDTTSTLGASSQKTTYEYQADKQGGKQYGNVTRTRIYSDGGATLYRTQERSYFPADVAGGVYIVNRPGWELLMDAANACQNETRIFYDGATNYATLPTRGDVTKIRVAQTACGGSWADTSYTYDAYGNQTSVSDALGNTTTTGYDTSVGIWPMLYVLPTSMTAPLVGTTSYVWDKMLGQVTSVTDPNQATTSYTYDQWGRQKMVIKPGDNQDNPTVRLSYSSYSGASAPYWVKQEQKESGSSYLESRTFYDGLGRVVQTQGEAASSSQSIVVSSRYGPLGVIQVTVPYMHNAGLGVGGDYRTPQWNQPGTLTAYDALGRVTQVTQPDGTTVKSFYQNRQTAVLDELNRQTISETDVFGRLRSVKQYLGTTGGTPNWYAPVYAQASYSYDIADRLVQMTGPDGAVTTITYDLLGRKTSMSDPDMGMWLYRWDLAGNLRKQRDARNVLTCFHYDNLNRLVGKSFHPNTPDPASVNCSTQPTPYPVAYSYDSGPNGKGRRTSMADPSGSTAWEYDVRGRMTKETKVVSGTGGGAFVTQWGYDSADRSVWMKYPDGNAGQIGEQVSYGYTAQGLLNTVVGTATYVGSTTYNARGQVTERLLGSTVGVVKQQYAYSVAENFRLVSMKAGNVAPYSNLQNLSYTYDDVGNVLTISDGAAYGGSQTQKFTYDTLNRLQGACTLSGATCAGSDGSYGTYSQRSFGYNNAGNLTAWSGAGFTYQDAAHKHAVTHVAGVQRYWYDANGNATRRISGSQDITLTYDAENRLTGVSGSVTASYVYDGDGNRVKETIAGVTRVFVGNHYEVDNGVVKKYYYAGDTRVAMRTAGALSYLLSDHLGSQALTLDSSGNRLNTNTEIRYYPYGGLRYSAGSTPTTFNFTGQRRDSGSGLLFYNARWYDPAIGRFIQPDTIVPEPGNPQALNRYSYANNSPLTYIDQDGHFAILPLLFAGGAAALVSAGVDLGKQLIVDQKDFANVNWGEVGGAAAGGFVAGATLGLAPAGASVIGLGLLGAAGGAAGSQAQAITQAGLEELLGTNPQGSVTAEARNLGLLDAQTMLINAGVGGLMGGLGGKFAGILRAKLNLPEAAGIARMSGELPHVRWQMRLDQPGVWTTQLEGRVINISADTFEKIVRGMAIGGYELVAKILEEAIQQGAVQVLEQEVQP